MFASQITQTLTIGDVTVTIKKLSWRSLRNAAEKQEARALEVAVKAGGFFQALAEYEQKRGAKLTASPQAARNAVYASFDRQTVLTAGIKSWTADVPVEKGIEDLDSDAADTIYRAIIDLSMPPADVAEADRGNA